MRVSGFTPRGGFGGGFEDSDSLFFKSRGFGSLRVRGFGFGFAEDSDSLRIRLRIRLEDSDSLRIRIRLRIRGFAEDSGIRNLLEVLLRIRIRIR